MTFIFFFLSILKTDSNVIFRDCNDEIRFEKSRSRMEANLDSKHVVVTKLKNVILCKQKKQKTNKTTKPRRKPYGE